MRFHMIEIRKRYRIARFETEQSRYLSIELSAKEVTLSKPLDALTQDQSPPHNHPLDVYQS